MPTTIDQTELIRAMAQQVAKGCQCNAPQTCDTLQCLCRPRFFPGQLLTDDDLNNLENYIVAKDRLHNRHLHGTGVVCGLEVVCNPCGEGVLVNEGYALGPCGEDIVVCQRTSVSIADLIHQCRVDRSRDSQCNSKYPTGSFDCEAPQQEWILSICYDECPSRGVTALRTSKSSSSCGCGCGCSSPNGSSKSASGCGCSNGKSTGNGSVATVCSCKSSSARSTSPQCEPTLICEGFKFVLTKAPAQNAQPNDPVSDWTSDSDVVKRFIACISNLMSSINPAARNTDLVTLERELLQLVKNKCFNPSGLRPQSNDLTVATRSPILDILRELGRECLCSAILPPCSTGSLDGCIPIATLTVDTQSSRVIDICNLRNRKFLLTFPNLGYWLDWMHPFAALRASVEAFCCGPVAAAQVKSNASGALTLTAEANVTSLRSAPAAGAATDATQMAEFDQIILALLGFAQSDGNSVSQDELLHPFSSVANKSFLAPMFTEFLRSMSGGGQVASAPTLDSNAEEIKNIRAEMEGMKQTIATLKKSTPKKTGRGN
jgi:hypothetical protein